MEYTISNKKFDRGFKRGNLYFQCDSLNEAEESVAITDGEFLTDYPHPETSKEVLFETTYLGSYNFISYNFTSDKLLIKNDKLGTYSLYIYAKGEDLIISNNIWKIILLLKAEDIIISPTQFKLMLGYWGVDMGEKTLFEGISEINAGHNVEIDLISLKIKKQQYFSLQQEPELILNEAIDKLDKDLDFTFSRINQHNTDKILGFGNSGGLDSRLVPIYASQHGIKSIAITAVNQKPKKLLDSITKLNALKISKLYGIPNYFLSHIVEHHDQRMLLDIRNNPFGPSQILKNAFCEMPDIDYYVTGGNGFIVGGAWTKFISIKSDKEFKDKFLGYHAKLNAYLWGNGNQKTIDMIFNESDIKEIKEQKLKFYEENRHKDNLSIIRSFHQYSMNKRSPAGGFESMNRLYKTYNIYYPIVFENSLKWKAEFFPGRSVLKNLIKKKSPLLYNIPSQNYDRLDGKSLSIKEKIVRRLANKYRNIGLDYETWVQHREFRNYANSLLARENDLFYHLLGLSKEEFIRLDVISNLRPHVSLDFLKLKKILDVIVYKEFEFVENKKFEIK